MRNRRALDNWRSIDVLIVDEASMMSADIFEKVYAVQMAVRIK